MLNFITSWHKYSKSNSNYLETIFIRNNTITNAKGGMVMITIPPPKYRPVKCSAKTAENKIGTLLFIFYYLPSRKKHIDFYLTGHLKIL